MRLRMMRGLSIGFHSSAASIKRVEPVGLERGQTRGQDSMVALLLFGLVREWLVPILQYSNVNGLREQLPFLIVIAAVLAADLLRLPQPRSWPVKLMFVCIAAPWAVVEGGGVSADKPLFSAFVLGMIHDGRMVLGGDPGAAGPFSRTFLFLLGWTMLTGVLYSLMLHVRSGLWFIAATWIFLLSLQYGTGEDMTDGIIRTLVLGLFLLAVQRLSHVMDQVTMKGNRPGVSGWWLAALIVVGCSAVIGLAGAGRESREIQPLSWDKLPKPIEAWVSRWQDMSENRLSMPEASPGLLRQSTTGYGQDDTRLGGPLKQDEQAVFTAKTPLLTYWRGESKDMYDGKGWRSTQDSKKQAASAVSLAAAKTITQEIVPSSAAVRGQLFAGGDIAAVVTMITDQGMVMPGQMVQIDPLTGKALVDASAGKLSYYKLEVIPTGQQVGSNEGDKLTAFSDLAPYLQLPERLPPRIQRLAQQITSGLSNPLDKANAIERYLSERYRYSLTEPDWPGKDVDFVDHFLFEQQVGYCDHFSTAMTVMLRTLGIPARWVKGYAPGQLDLSTSASSSAEREQPYIVTVRNLDAHSWVEMWVSGRGWIPFDPTPGFPGMGSGSFTPVAASDSAAVEAGMAASSAKPDGSPSPVIVGGDQGWKLPLLSKIMENVSRILSFPTIVGMFLAPIILWPAWLAWRAVRPGLRQPHWIVLRGLRRGRKQRAALIRVLTRIWRGVEREYGAMRPVQTYREYVRTVQLIDDDGRRILSELAHLTEKVFYDTAEIPVWIPKRRLKQIWRQLQRRSGKQNVTSLGDPVVTVR